MWEYKIKRDYLTFHLRLTLIKRILSIKTKRAPRRVIHSRTQFDLLALHEDTEKHQGDEQIIQTVPLIIENTLYTKQYS